MFLEFSGEFSFFLIHRKTLQLMFFFLSYLSAKGCGSFLSYNINQLALHVPGKYILVAERALVAMIKERYFLLKGRAANLESGRSAQNGPEKYSFAL